MTPEALRSAMLCLRMTPGQLAAYLRVSESSVSRWLSGKQAIGGPIAKLVEMALQEGR